MRAGIWPSSLLKNSEACHPEESQSTKDPRIALILQMRGCFAFAEHDRPKPFFSELLVCRRKSLRHGADVSRVASAAPAKESDAFLFRLCSEIKEILA